MPITGLMMQAIRNGAAMQQAAPTAPATFSLDLTAAPYASGVTNLGGTTQGGNTVTLVSGSPDAGCFITNAAAATLRGGFRAASGGAGAVFFGGPFVGATERQIT